MEEEVLLSGYCRQIDQSRRVIVEFFDGEMDVGCSYDSCSYAPNCTIAQQISEWIEEL